MLCPRCALDDVTVGARLLGQSVPPPPPLNLTVRARARIAEAFRTVVTNGTRFGSMVALAGARVTLNLTTDADADGARLLDDDVWVAASASAPRCEYNYTALTDASGAFRLDVAHPTSAHQATATLRVAAPPADGESGARYAPATRDVALNATSLNVDAAARYTWVEGFRAPVWAALAFFRLAPLNSW